jgi:hypothetical protein
MYDAFATAENGVNSADPEGYAALTTAPSLHACAHHGALAACARSPWRPRFPTGTRA